MHVAVNLYVNIFRLMLSHYSNKSQNFAEPFDMHFWGRQVNLNLEIYMYIYIYIYIYICIYTYIYIYIYM